MASVAQGVNCPYYPCSKHGDNCKHCYCPFYPCKNTDTMGKYITTKTGYELWDCSDCIYIHQDYIVSLLNLDINERNPHILKIAWNRIRRIINVKSSNN